MNSLPQLPSEALHSIYEICQELQCDEVHAAQGIKVATTRVRVKLARIIRLAKQARKDLPSVDKRSK